MIEDQNKSTKLKCPQFGCGTTPSEEEVKAIISSDSFSKYQKFINNQRVARSKNLFFCPSPDCESVIDTKSAK